MHNFSRPPEIRPSQSKPRRSRSLCKRAQHKPHQESPNECSDTDIDGSEDLDESPEVRIDQNNATRFTRERALAGQSGHSGVRQVTSLPPAMSVDDALELLGLEGTGSYVKLHEIEPVVNLNIDADPDNENEYLAALAAIRRHREGSSSIRGSTYGETIHKDQSASRTTPTTMRHTNIPRASDTNSKDKGNENSLHMQAPSTRTSFLKKKSLTTSNLIGKDKAKGRKRRTPFYDSSEDSSDSDRKELPRTVNHRPLKSVASHGKPPSTSMSQRLKHESSPAKTSVPEKCTGRRLNLGRLKQVMNNGGTSVTRRSPSVLNTTSTKNAFEVVSTKPEREISFESLETKRPKGKEQHEPRWHELSPTPRAQFEKLRGDTSARPTKQDETHGQFQGALRKKMPTAGNKNEVRENTRMDTVGESTERKPHRTIGDRETRAISKPNNTEKIATNTFQTKAPEKRKLRDFSPKSSTNVVKKQSVNSNRVHGSLQQFPEPPQSRITSTAAPRSPFAVSPNKQIPLSHLGVSTATAGSTSSKSNHRIPSFSPPSPEPIGQAAVPLAASITQATSLMTAGSVSEANHLQSSPPTPMSKGSISSASTDLSKQNGTQSDAPQLMRRLTPTNRVAATPVGFLGHSRGSTSTTRPHPKDCKNHGATPKDHIEIPFVDTFPTTQEDSDTSQHEILKSVLPKAPIADMGITPNTQQWPRTAVISRPVDITSILKQAPTNLDHGAQRSPIAGNASVDKVKDELPIDAEEIPVATDELVSRETNTLPTKPVSTSTHNTHRKKAIFMPHPRLPTVGQQGEAPTQSQAKTSIKEETLSFSQDNSTGAQVALRAPEAISITPPASGSIHMHDLNRTDETTELPIVRLPDSPLALTYYEEHEPYFEYTVFQKLWSDSYGEDLKPLELTTCMLTSVEEANSRAERFFAAANKQYPQFFQISFQNWSITRNEDGCISQLGTFTPIEFPKKKMYIKIWVERHYVSSHAAAVQPPMQNTPFISKTLYILRLHKLIENPRPPSHVSDTDSSSDLSTSESEDGDDPDRGKHNKKAKAKAELSSHSPPRKRVKTASCAPIRISHPLPCTEIYTTLDSANRAAGRLQLEMSHEKDPVTPAKRKWQEQNAKRLLEQVQALELASEEKKEYWRSEFNEGKLGGDRFELMVERVGVCGPRNV